MGEVVSPYTPSQPRNSEEVKTSKLNWVKKTCVVFLLYTTAAVALPAQTFTTLYTFCRARGCKTGSRPLAALVQGTDGNFYGTASQTGGAVAPGTVFKITPSGMLTTMHKFDWSDGAIPSSALVQGADGNFYGTTIYGGAGYDCGLGDECGTIFKITPDGKFTNLHNFCTQPGCPDGAFPEGLVQGADGKFYGTTEIGGYSSCPGGYGVGCGTVFSITPSGVLTTLYSFCSQGGSNCSDGNSPRAGLVQGIDGKFYGTTAGGGGEASDSCSFGCGTVFSMTPGGTLTTIHIFAGPDGALPSAVLIQATNGDFYGTTSQGGTNDNSYCDLGGVPGCGVVFEISSDGVLTTLYSFCSLTHCADGTQPTAGLVQATDGNLYGTTQYAGAEGHGTAFQLTPGGVLTTIHDFCAQGYPCTDGSFPTGGLFQATNGTLYGTDPEGATRGHECHYGCGTIFSLSVELVPFVETEPVSGKLGKRVKILGTSLTGATSVTFNGTPATFTVVSGSEITTTVPAGATTGRVKVVTPGGTLSSNMPFRVRCLLESTLPTLATSDLEHIAIAGDHFIQHGVHEKSEE